jgi:hypothetical protein
MRAAGLVTGRQRIPGGGVVRRTSRGQNGRRYPACSPLGVLATDDGTVPPSRSAFATQGIARLPDRIPAGIVTAAAGNPGQYLARAPAGGPWRPAWFGLTGPATEVTAVRADGPGSSPSAATAADRPAGRFRQQSGDRRRARPSVRPPSTRRLRQRRTAAAVRIDARGVGLQQGPAAAGVPARADAPSDLQGLTAAAGFAPSYSTSTGGGAPPGPLR